MTLLFGGTFNPPHVAHRVIAEYAYDFFKPDKFLITVADIPPHKDSDEISSFEQRFDWCKKTFPEERFFISDIEKKLPKPSYTYYTLKYLYESDKSLILLIGEDSLFNFKTWFNWQFIPEFCQIAVYPRFFDGKGFENPPVPYIKIDSPIMDISSTEIRNRILSNKSIYGLVSDNIANDLKPLL